MVFTHPTQTHLLGREGDGILRCSSLCRPDGNQGQQDRRSDTGQGAQDSNTTKDELPMGRQSRPQRRGEDHEVRPASSRAEETVPGF